MSIKFSHLAQELSRIQLISSTNEKLVILSEFITSSDCQERANLLKLLAEGTIFKKSIHYSKKSFAKVSQACVRYENSTQFEQTLSESEITVSEVLNLLESISDLKGVGSQGKKDSKFQGLMQVFSTSEWLWLYRIVTGLKIGLSNKSLSKIFGSSSKEIIRDGLMLASPITLGCISQTEIKDYLIQRKLDGIRVNILVKQGKISGMISRNGRDLSPSIGLYFENIFSGCEDCSLDGELWATEGFQSLSRLITRRKHLQSQELPHLTYTIFDILSLNDISLQSKTLIQRKQILQELNISEEISEELSKITTEIIHYESVSSCSELEHMLNTKFSQEEGVVVKNKHSIYQRKRSKSWMKLKHQFETIDVLIPVVQRGNGARNKYFAVYHAYTHDVESGLLKCIGLVGSGFNQAQLTELTDRIMSEENLTVLPPVGVQIKLKNPLVFEIKFQSLQDTTAQKSQNHRLSCRFPIFVRQRWDKSSDEVSTI